jgi:hypothetical protein
MAMQENKEFDIFNLSVKDVETHADAPKTNSELYSPKADDGKDGVYKALIRFLPNPKNPTKSILRKFVYWLEDEQGNGGYYDSPSTIGEKCPVQDLFFKLRNSDSALDQKLSEKLKRRAVFYSIIQIMRDPQNPELEGSIKIFKYGWQIKKKIDEELNPEFSEPTQIFDLFEGKNFELIITKQAGFNNYDSSKFQGSRSAMTLNGNQVERTKESQANIMEFLKEAPELETWDYQPWDEATRTKISGILSQYGSHGTMVKEVTKTNTVSSDDVLDSMSTSESPVEDPSQIEDSSEDEGSGLKDFLDDLDL